MVVIPELNYNKHPREAKNCSLVDAVNIMIDNDSFVIGSDHKIDFIDNLNDTIGNATTLDFQVLYAIPCNKEIVFFIKDNYNSNKFRIVRFDGNFENGWSNINLYNVYLDYLNIEDINFTSTFTYNKNHLIIAYSQYSLKEDIKTPLNVIDLGEFEQVEVDTNNFVASVSHSFKNIPKFNNNNTSIIPKVKIPKVKTSIVDGLAYKGWYYIFIRFKISTNNYTQWYNTNEAVFVDSYRNEYIEQYYIGSYKSGSGITVSPTGYKNPISYNLQLSDASSLAKVSFEVNISNFYNNNDINSNYNEYQLGFILINKDETKGFKTDDININTVNYKFNNKSVVTEDIKSLITTYINYYNVKSIDSYNNSLYIANYHEDYNEDEVVEELKDINLDIFENISTLNKEVQSFGISTLSDGFHDQVISDIEGPDAAIARDVEYLGYFYAAYGERYDDSAVKFAIVKLDLGEQEVITHRTPSGTVTKGNVDFTVKGIQLSFYHFGDNEHVYGGGMYFDSISSRNTNTYLLARGGNDTNFDGTRLYKIRPSISGDNSYYVCSANGLFAEVDEENKFTNKYILFGYKVNSEYNEAVDYSIDPNDRGIYGRYEINCANIKQLDNTNYNNYNAPHIVAITQGPYSLVDYGTSNVDISTPSWKTPGGNDINGTIINFTDYWILCTDSVYRTGSSPEINNPEYEEGVIEGESKKIIKSNCNIPNEWYNFYIHFVDEYGIATNGFQINKFNVNLHGFEKNFRFGPSYNTTTNQYNENPQLGSINLNELIGGIYQLNLFNADQFKRGLSELTSSDDYDNSEEDLLLKTKDEIDEDTDNNFVFRLSEIPDKYVGYFISYEKLDTVVKHKGFVYWNNNSDGDGDGKFKFYSDKFGDVDYDISFDFNTIRIYSNDNTFRDYKITQKQLYVADSYNNILKPTHILISVDKQGSLTNTSTLIPQYAILYKADFVNNGSVDSYDNLYPKSNKELVPCSKVIYRDDEYETVIVNTKTGFRTTISSLIYESNIYFDNTRKVFAKSARGGSTTTLAVTSKPWVEQDKTKIKKVDTIPWESMQFNNKPDIIAFPMNPDSTDANHVTVVDYGVITEMKNSIDLFNNRRYTYYDNYPKLLTNYNKNNLFINNFNKTIRRSNIINDESNEVKWRFFETENYKNIIENKGNIIKLAGVGNMFLVHTEYSLFQFNADSTLNSSNNGNVTLGNSDIWDINYREVLTSKLGYAGIKHSDNAILGNFGYIFYSEDNQAIFRYDNGKLEEISTNINAILRPRNTENLIIKLDVDKIKFYDDKVNNRLFIKFDSKASWSSFTLSYNYKFNTFVSRHRINFETMYSTSNKLYIINDKIKHHINDYDNTDISASILINSDYELIKVLEFIKYKINMIDCYAKSDGTVGEDYPIPIISDNIYKFTKYYRYLPYSGDYLIINTETCNTGRLDINCTNGVPTHLLVKQEDTNINTKMNTINGKYEITKPYYEQGIWNFNYIRDNITNYPNIKSDNLRRVYGNYFVVTFVINNDSNKKIEIESIDYKVSKNLT